MVMEPRVTKRERKLILQYDLHHRVHSAQLYPFPAPNGSEIIICARGNGVRILWRGGRRRCQAQNPRESRQQPNGTKRRTAAGRTGDGDSKDDDDESHGYAAADCDDFEDEEDEQDPDCSYPPIIQDVDVSLSAEVLHLVTPQLPASLLRQRDALRKYAAVAVACSNGSLQVLTFDLLPPRDQDKQRYAESVLSRAITFPTDSIPCSALSAAIKVADGSDGSEGSAIHFLLVAATSDVLRTYKFAIFDQLTTLENTPQIQRVELAHRVTKVTFDPSRTSSRLLIADVSGAVRVVEVFPASTDTHDAEDDAVIPLRLAARWITSFLTPYTIRPSGVAQRKHVLAAAWILSGKAILVLLEDGEWGIWDFSAGVSESDEFMARGSLASTASSGTTLPIRPSKNSSRLAPMTPNTRKAKAETLFSGPTKSTVASPQGGIDVSLSSSDSSQADESVIMWYGSEIFAIPSISSFWQRSTNRSATGMGSLYAPGLTLITDISLFNESITSISQFAPPVANSGVGQMNTIRDLLISSEHRLIVSQSMRSPSAITNPLFHRSTVDMPPLEDDQRMLDVGELDLGGVDRMLNSMAHHGEGRPRRVGFAT